MKKFIAMLLALVLCLSVLTACGSKKDDTEAPAEDNKETAAAADDAQEDADASDA